MSKVTDKLIDGYDFFKDNEQDINLLLKESSNVLNEIGVTSTTNNNTFTDGQALVKDHIIKREKQEFFQRNKTNIIFGGVGLIGAIILISTFRS